MNRMNGNRIPSGSVISGMHTYELIPLAVEDMRLIAGGLASDMAGDLPTLPPVRNRDVTDPGTGLRTDYDASAQVSPPGLDIASMMLQR